MKRLVIIDGKSVFYRGFYAMGALSTKAGEPTGGVYGFAAIAMELVKKLNPNKVVVAWDKAKTSISKRKAIYSEYKAGRVKPPEEFFQQIPLLRELIEALGWEFIECDGYEADDIIGTLAKQADEAERPEKWETYIISSDLDMLQIVDENTKMYRIVKGFSEIEEMDVRAVEEKYGIRKAQFLDLKALKGDTSDNIPGVPGIGEKTAVKLLNEYGTVDGIYEHIEEITGATQKKLIEGRESAEMSYKLAKIDTTAPVKLDEVPELVVDSARIVKAFQRLEFKSLIRKYFPEENFGESEMVKTPQTENGEMMKSYDEYLVEWDVKRKMHENPEFAEKVLGGAKIWDLKQGRFLLNPLGKYEELGLLANDEETKKREFVRQRKNFINFPKLYKVFCEMDMPLVPVLYKMEKTGIKIDREYFQKLKEEFSEKTQALEKEVQECAGVEFNVNSPVQLSEVLFNKLGINTKGIKKTSRGYSTGAKELEKLKNEHPVVGKIIEYREAAKLLSTYIVPMLTLADAQDRIHTTFTQDVTATGRLSSVNPNLQNIPVRSEEGKRIREGFVPSDGKIFVSADYSQFELRLAAVLSGDAALVKDFESGVDIHKKTASEAFNVDFDKVTPMQRRAAKVINFGVLYGMSAKSLGEQAEMSTSEAKEFIDRYFQMRKPIKDYLDKTLEMARNEGYVETYYGRRKPTPDVKSPNFLIRSGAERAAQNMPIQGTEADLVKRAMIVLDKELPDGAELIMQVHDSLMVECDEEQVEEVAGIMKWVMESVAPELDVRLDVDVEVEERWG